MINLEPNKKKRQGKTSVMKYKMISFRPQPDLDKALKAVCNTTKFIHDAIRFYLRLIKNPIEVLSELKREHPDEWKYVNRRKF